MNRFDLQAVQYTKKQILSDATNTVTNQRNTPITKVIPFNSSGNTIKSSFFCVRARAFMKAYHDVRINDPV